MLIMSETKINPHDRFFKEALTQPETASEFIRLYLSPSVSSLLDTNRVEQIKDSFVDEELQEHFSDLQIQRSIKTRRLCFCLYLARTQERARPMGGFSDSSLPGPHLGKGFARRSRTPSAGRSRRFLSWSKKVEG
jgi:hypothetical protein